MKKAVLIDVSAVMYRSYFALMNMRNSKGEPTGAVYGFTNVLLSIIKTFKPDYIAACFDVKKSTLKRREIYKEYKENRKPMPEDLLSQISKIEEVLDIFNIKRYKIEGYEADDVLGSLARKIENSEEEVKTYIVTGDKDLSQVLNEKTKIALIGTKNQTFKLLESNEDIIEQLGVRSDQIPDLFGLQGDSSDGIPGVPGVGPKTAVKWIDKYNDIETLYENIDDIKGKAKEKLIANKDLAFISRKLAVIEQDIKFDFHLKDLSVQDYNNNQLFDFFKNIEFKVLIKKLKLEENSKEEVELEENKFEITIINSNDDLASIFDKKEVFLFYSKTGVSLANDTGIYYIPLYHNYLGAKNIDKNTLQSFLEKDINCIAYDFKKILNNGFKIKNIYLDIMLANYLLNPDIKQDLEGVIFNKIGINLESYKDVFSKKEELSLSIEEASDFYGKRVYYLKKISSDFKKSLEEEHLWDIYKNIELALVPVLSSVEKEGIKIDKNYFAQYEEELKQKLKLLENNIYNIANEEFNINSTKQLADLLFNKMGIMPVKKTKTGFSTDNEVLEILSKRDVEIADSILIYRKLSKLLSTYVSALPKLTDNLGRLHTSFNQNGTATGRLSSSNPNLQNIPVKSDEGMRIREGFIARPSYKLLAADYSQIELRVLAAISQDPALINAYKNEEDLHSLTARRIFELNEDSDISRDQRSVAKIVNFSIIYGKTAFGLSKEINISPAEAKLYIEKYFDQYKEVKNFIDSTIKSAEEKEYVETLFNRKRWVNGINSSNKNIKNHAQRMAVNSIIQGTAADILKIVMIDLYDKIKDSDDIKMILQVHDELLFEIKEDKLEYYKNIIKECMENSVKLNNVNLTVNIKTGNNWGETK